MTPVESKRHEIVRFVAHCLFLPPVARHARWLASEMVIRDG
jgi:hypothetical protein